MLESDKLLSWWLFQDFRRLFVGDKAPAEQRHAFARFARRRTIANGSGTLVLIAFSTLLWWPMDGLVLASEFNEAGAFLRWRINNLASAGVYLAILFVLDRGIRHDATRIRLALAVTFFFYLWGNFFTAYAVADVQNPEDHWMYYSYVSPVIGLAFLVPLANRVVITVGGSIAIVSGFVVVSPALLDYPLFLNYLSLMAFSTFWGIMVGHLIYVLVREGFYKKRFMESQIESQIQQMRGLARSLQSRLEKERATIGRELHDELGQGLAAIRFESESAARSAAMAATKPSVLPRCVAGLEHISTLSATLTENIRRIIAELRPRLLENLGLTQACVALAEQFEHRNNISLHLEADEELRPRADLALTIFRILQESLHNIEKHASATSVRIELKREGAHLVLRVADNGVGLGDIKAEESLGVGLLGMCERAAAMGGATTYDDKTARGGLTVCTQIPWQSEDNPGEHHEH